MIKWVREGKLIFQSDYFMNKWGREGDIKKLYEV